MAAPNSNAYRLLTCLQAYAPDGDAQQICTDMLHDMEHLKESDEMIELGLVGAIYDGLRYGNWPWVLRNKKNGDAWQPQSKSSNTPRHRVRKSSTPTP